MLLRRLFLCTALAIMPGIAGCLAVAVGAGAAAGVGTYAYVTGKLTSTVDAPLDRTFDATTKALETMGFNPVSTDRDAFQGRFVSKMADDTEVKVDLAKKTETSTEVSIRVGTFGDEKQSVAILDEIKKNLNL
ncbi:hypothetical protein PHYC_02646 [Phycisphaerales bacterium]|nr:hypothetical protein PHYC_02646 [Phycisphaerales bacterium]